MNENFVAIVFQKTDKPLDVSKLSMGEYEKSDPHLGIHMFRDAGSYRATLRKTVTCSWSRHY